MGKEYGKSCAVVRKGFCNDESKYYNSVIYTMQYTWILEGLHMSYHKFIYAKLCSTLSGLREFPDLI